MNRLLFLLIVTPVLTLQAQKTEEGFDVSFRPTTGAPRYYVMTEPQGERWHREAYYLPEKSMAMEGWYKDKDCKIPDGELRWYHTTKTLKSRGTYVDGKKEGIWLEYHDNGMMKDSLMYVNGRRNGAGIAWNKEGFMIDSSFFDGQGNGTQISWHANGPGSAAGYWTADTSKIKRWKYYHTNGKLKATEDYENGKRINCSCFTENEEPMDSSLCKDRQAAFPGEDGGWRKFLEKNLDGNVPIKNRAPLGTYMVMVQFVVNAEGGLEDITPLTKFGFGMEEEILRLLKKSPRWIPAMQFGRNVRAYRRQPVTFKVGAN